MPKFIFPLVIFLLPLVFWTLTPNYFQTPKLLLLILVILALVLNWVFKLLASRTLVASSSPLRLGLLSFALVIVINVVINPAGQLESLIGPAIFYLLPLIFCYFLTLYLTPTLEFALLSSFVASTSILSIHSILQLTLFSRLSFLPAFMQTRAFSLSGSPLTTFILLVLGAGINLSLSLYYHKHKPWFMASLALHLISLIALGILLYPGGELALNLLPLKASWNIALDAMKSARSFFLGIGLTQFPNFFKSVKPLYLNSTPFWNALPLTSSSELLHLLTTTGILGFLSFLSLPFLALKHPSSPIHSGSLTTTFKLLLALSGLALIFSPGSLPVLTIFFVSLAAISHSVPSITRLTRPASFLVTLVVLSLSVYLAYFTTRVVAAESKIRLAQQALNRNDGRQVYEYHLSAIKLLPQMTAYHLSYSQVNLTLASALSQKSESLSDADNQKVSQLLSQAVREAKFATNLNPNNSQTWQNLGIIYKNLLSIGGGTDQFALDAYSRAVSLDPGNPALRVEFGGLLYQIGQTTKKTSDQPLFYQRAKNEFQTAIQLKSDYANAYYNLSKVQETLGDYPSAILALQKSIDLLDPDSPDLDQAKDELEALQARIKP